MKSMSVFFDITKATDLRWKNTDISRTQEGCVVIFIFFSSSLGKV